MSTIRNKRLLRTMEQLNFRQVPVEDLKKVSRAITILQQSNAKLSKVLKQMHVFYERKYKLKLVELEGALSHKKRQIEQLEEDIPTTFLFLVRQDNVVHLIEDFEKVNEILSQSGGGKVLLCRLTKSLAVERALCIALAKSNWGDSVKLRDNNCLEFKHAHDIDAYDKEVRVMFNHNKQ
ncbi:hypothetical protein [Mamestra configurata nucleopolyhedrovirus B]|uniref:Maco-B 35 n=1 Tax=Mamestra configurata nucleopolyhedrovirus B TaxID=204440 RepID=Q8JMB7_9ABAC|nr:hypothetical protein McnBVgp035 [Mamestra configurata nucleopolyhedrovirus B]AAM95022.1 hypothetical protein [Mamestra configurata nucleopolyhedrovirus B]QNH90683.1 maco-B 35 [Mamestra configurata nucleopolyhedrovirus B]